MRIAVVLYDLPPEGGGGHTFQQTLLAALRKAAPASDHEFTYYVAGDASGAGPDVVPIRQTRRDRARRVAIQALRDVQDRLNLPRGGLRTPFERALAARGIELVWFASHHLEPCEPQPFVCTVWDLAHLTTPWFPEVGADGEWERRQHYFARMLPRAACVIVPNEALTEVVERAYGVGRERVLELPFPTPEFVLDPPPVADEQAVLERLGIERPYLLYPAQFWAHKNHRGAFEALARLNARRDTPLRLALVGSDKGQLEHVRSLARRCGVADRVAFLGFVDAPDLIALYRNAHALLYLSFFGPENLPPLEALALGCPVVCADVPGMRLQLGDAAAFAPPTDPDAIAAAVERAESERDALAAAGVERARRGGAEEYVAAVLEWLDGFAPIRGCWP
jgi:glycosyltransferase involved in cell wall biosynthesis